MASWSPHGRQNASQDNPKTPKKVRLLLFFEMQPMQQVTKKCSRNLPKGSKNRAQDAQDAAKMASWSPHGRQNASQDAPKTAKKVLFFSFFSGFWCQMLPRAPQDTQFEPTSPKTAPKMLQVAHPTPQTIKKPIKT